MKSIKANTFFRINFILQDNSASTTRNYLAKIIEFILFESKSKLDINEIRRRIIDEFALEFTVDELLESISKKNDNIVKASENEYSLTPECASRLSRDKSIEEDLRTTIKNAIVELKMDIGEDQLYNLITRYLYFCFNTNKDMLLSLIDGTKISDPLSSFKANNEEISAINRFLLWQNAEKNALIYKLVSYCYVYCSLNTKKDALLSKNIFKSKRFYLDANIIFRLAGINNDDRKSTINSFAIKCKDLGIKLCYTDLTYNELFRVLDSKVKWLNYINNTSEPIDLESRDISQNDFYNMYVEWCKDSRNTPGEYLDFKKYLSGIINNTLSSFEYVKTSHVIGRLKKNDLENQCLSLKNIKEKDDRVKNYSTASLETDVKNVFFVDYERSTNSDKGNIFSTNDYFISADQNLIEWTQTQYAGIPIAVLPSLWLTIMLRFTGRTNDDYNAFCLFMNLRMHKERESIDIFNLIRELRLHTDDKSLKEQIITEIIDHRKEYSKDFSLNDDCESVVNKAFDVILKENIDAKEELYKKQIGDREAIISEEQEKKLELERNLQINSHAGKAAQDYIDRKFKKLYCLKTLFNVIGIGIPAIAALLFILYIFGFQPIVNIVCVYLPSKYINNDVECFLALGAAVALIANVPNALLAFLASDERKKKLYNKKEKEFKDIFLSK